MEDRSDVVSGSSYEWARVQQCSEYVEVRKCFWLKNRREDYCNSSDER